MKLRTLNCSDIYPVENTSKICIIFANFHLNILVGIQMIHFNSKYLLSLFSLFVSRVLLKALQQVVVSRLLGM